jgi:hypothetical protein
MRTIYKILALPVIFSLSLNAAAQNVAQNVIASSGGSGLLSDGNTLYFTIGEPIIATGSAGSTQITQGFHQKFNLGTLPVSLTTFTASSQKYYHQLKWTTSMELNNDHFLIERSVGDGLFNPLNTVYSKAPNGNSIAPLHYTYANYDVKEGINYYRLKQFDKDGQWKYSEIVELKSNGLNSDELTLYPNPATNEVKLYIKGDIGKTAKAQITNITGQLVSEIKVSSATTPINTKYLSTGTYFLQYYDGTLKKVIKFVKL